MNTPRIETAFFRILNEMKKLFLILSALSLVLLGFLYTEKENAKAVNSPSPLHFAQSARTKAPAGAAGADEYEQIPADTASVLALLLSPHIDKAVNEYFGKPVRYALCEAKILDASAAADDSCRIEIAVQTFPAPGDPPCGSETMTFTLQSGGRVFLDEYVHADAAP